MTDLTQEELKRHLAYNSESGEFSWHGRKHGTKSGAAPGCINSIGYHVIRLNRKLYLAHRLAWLYIYGEWPIHQIDHINQQRDDNRIDNLRDVTKAENARNIKAPTDTASGIRGVHLEKCWNKWLAHICVDGKHINLGRFHDFFEACCARKSAEKKYGFHSNHGKLR